MIRLIEIVGVRHLEAALDDPALATRLPGRLLPQAFAAQIANVNFGVTEDGLFPHLPPCNATDAEWLAYNVHTERVQRRLHGDHIADDEDRISFFLNIGFDITNDSRNLARCSTFFTRIIEAGALGWLSPCPNPTLEKWRRLRMNEGPTLPLQHANDDYALPGSSPYRAYPDAG